MRQLVTDVALIHDDQFAFLHFFDQRSKLILVKLLGEQRVDRIFQCSDLPWPGLTAAAEVLDDRRNLLIHARRRGYTQYRNLSNIFFSLNAYSAALEMCDQRIKSFVLTDDMKLSIRVFARQLADVIRDMKIESILTIAGYLDVPGVIAQKLHRIRKIKWHLRLTRAHEDKHFERMLGEKLQVLGVDVLKIDQNVVSGQESLQLHMW